MSWKVFFCVACAAFFLAGCARPQYYWYREGTDRFETENREAQCKYDVSMRKLKDKAEQLVTVQDCMKMQGFRWRVY